MALPFAVWVCLAQGLYFLATGLWPLVNIETFQAVTGPKYDHLPSGNEADHWLVNTVGVLIIAIALVLLYAAYARRVSPEVALLALASAIGLTAIDVVYTWRGVIAPVYLADAALEVVFAGYWLSWFLRRSRASPHRGGAE